MIDLHHHLLYGLDDGPKSFEETQLMLKEAHRQGITEIVASAHAVPGRDYFDMERYMHRLNKSQEWCIQNGLSLKLHSGAEIFYTSNTARMLEEHKIPTIACSNHVLLEFSPKVSFDQLCSAAETLISHGYDPVFAHVERYECLRHIRNIEKLKRDYQILMQVNARTLFSPSGLLLSFWLNRVLRSGLIDIAASDAHNMSSRKCRMKMAYDRILAEYGEPTANKLFKDTAECVICAD